MFDERRFRGGAPLVQIAFEAECNRAVGNPLPAISDEVLKDMIKIIMLYGQPQNMPGELTVEILQQLEETVTGAMYTASMRLIASPDFQQLIQTLGLNVEKTRLLNLRQLASLLTVGYAEQIHNATNQSLPAPSATAVANLFARLEQIGISFEILSHVEYKKFELIVAAAAPLLNLESMNIHLNKLLELSYLQIWALSMPENANENRLITTARHQAIQLLNAPFANNNSAQYHMKTTLG